MCIKIKSAALAGAVSFVALAVASPANAQTGDEANDFTSLSLEDLMAVEVTTASKRPERANEAAAAVFVLTREDITRSGATTIPDALRLVPGVNVARINSNSSAVTVRGFNSRFANKLLVMIDGRSVFTPLFSGVFWDKQNIVLEDIERIEVVRGPGGTLWGANAVNGVINIITRSARDTKGAYAQVAGGTELLSQAIFRYGGDLGDNGAFRVYGKFESFDEGQTAAGIEANDDWRNFRGGFRADFDPSARDSVTLTSEVSVIEGGETVDTPLFVAPFLERRDEDTERLNAHILGRWSRTLGDDSEFSVQGYLDYSRIDITQGVEKRLTFDLAVQHAFGLGERHDLLWGFGFRNISDDIESSELVTFPTSSRNIQIYNGFVQDTVTLTPSVDVTIGAKFERNDYTGFEIQPSARFLWRAKEDITVWGSVSRAVRIPSRAEAGVQSIAAVVPPGVGLNAMGMLPLALQFTGDPSIDSESLIAYEVGARFRVHQNLSLDIAAFYNSNENLRGSRIGSPSFVPAPTPFVALPLTVDELADADTHGVEIVADWQVLPTWRVQATYSYLDVEGSVASGPDVLATPPGGSDPDHSATLRSLVDFTDRLRFDTSVRFVDNLPGSNIDAYAAIDARISWRMNDNFELAVTGRNLTNHNQFEFGVDQSFATVPTATERSVFATVSAKF